MDAVTYPHADVKKELDGNWLHAHLDVSEDREVTRLFGVAAIPTAVAVAGDGTILGSIRGFVEPASFQEELRALR